ncbi:hypothetical protein RUND412_009860 [Rhizina undulata]
MKFGQAFAAAAAFLVAATEAAPSFQLYSRALTFPYGQEKVRGVNLGGWFVLEPWITPSLFDQFGGSVVDEYNFCLKLGKDKCYQQLRQHWDTWITYNDLQAIKAAGLNHLRIPIGYWAIKPISGDPYVSGQLEFLDRALGWARSLGLKVWLDLHGAPGSQNGFDNSGWRDHLQWQTGGTVQWTVETIRVLAAKYAAAGFNDVITGIELLNEPLGPELNMDIIRQYWLDGYGAVREYSPDIAVVIHDAFQPVQSWNGFMMAGWNHVILDTHHYEVFSPGVLQLTLAQHIGSVCSYGRQIQGADKWTVTGEWSAARTDCTKYLNGVGRGTRWEGTFPGSWWQGNCGNRVSGSVASYSDEERRNSRAYIEAQIDSYERGAGWIFWTWKTEQGSPDWELRDLIANGVFPQPIDQRWFPNQCGF